MLCRMKIKDKDRAFLVADAAGCCSNFLITSPTGRFMLLQRRAWAWQECNNCNYSLPVCHTATDVSDYCLFTPAIKHQKPTSLSRVATLWLRNCVYLMRNRCLFHQPRCAHTTECLFSCRKSVIVAVGCSELIRPRRLNHELFPVCGMTQFSIR